MESFEVFSLACYGGFATSLFGILLFYGLKKKGVLSSRTVMLPLGIILMGLGIILMGLEIIVSMKYSFIAGLTVMFIGGVLFFIGFLLHMWQIWKNKPQLKK